MSEAKDKVNSILNGIDHAILSMQKYQVGDPDISQAVTFFQTLKQSIVADLDAVEAPPVETPPPTETSASATGN